MIFLVVRPLTKMAGAMGRLAGGDLAVEVVGKDLRDEVGTLARSLEVFKQNAVEARRWADKGFAVVASEVKSLANQTAKATEEMGAQIDNIQATTKQAVDAIQGIGTIIDEINGIAAAIAATQEIARNVHQAAAGTQEVTRNISSVNESSTASGAAATQVLSAASELSKQAEGLTAEVNSFIAQVEAA